MKVKKSSAVLFSLVAAGVLVAGAVVVPALAGEPATPENNEYDQGPVFAIDETSDKLHEYLTASWEGFSSLEMKNRQSFIAYGVELPANSVKQKAAEVAAPFVVEYQLSRVQMSDYQKRAEELMERAGDDVTIIRQMMTTSGDQKVYVELSDEGNVDAIEQLAREVFAGLPLEIKRVSPDTGPVVTSLAGRWNDSTPFYSGAEIHSNGVGCTSAFSAKRNSDGAKVMLTAWHCNALNAEPGDKTVRTFRTGDPNTAIGKSGDRWPSGTGGADVMYLTSASGTSFGSGMYVGNWKNTTYKTRKSANNPTSVGQEVRMGGAYSGGATGFVSKLNVTVIGRGTGFYWDDNMGDATVGPGDSGGPAYSAHSDGTYSARGILLGVGLYMNRYGDWVRLDDKLCAQGDLSRDVSCNPHAFALNISEAESRLDVDVYPS